MKEQTDSSKIRLALPKGHIQEAVFELLADAGIRVQKRARNYRPSFSLSGYEVKILKPQSIGQMLDAGAREIGFTGADWVEELGADVELLLDTGLDPVRLVAAAPPSVLDENGTLPDRKLVVASEYENITKKWIRNNDINAEFLNSYGATEVYPPEDADCIVDVTSTGATLRANSLQIADELRRSSTCLFAYPDVLENPEKKEKIDQFVILLRSVLEARKRVMLEVNVGEDNLDQIIDLLPAMREPTVSTLHGEDGYAVKVAVQRERLPHLIPEIKNRGGTDVIVTDISQIIA